MPFPLLKVAGRQPGDFMATESAGQQQRKQYDVVCP
jgi:hypothetical protein